MILAIDGTHEATATKYKNQEQSPVRIGQRVTWEQGQNYSVIHDTTEKLNLSVIHTPIHREKMSPKTLRPSIRDLIESVEVVQETGRSVELILGDRGYYESEYFATSHLGLLGGQSQEFVRFMAPQKFSGRKKNDVIWGDLLDPSFQEVSLGSIQLNHYAPQVLRDACQQAGLTPLNGFYRIPVARVALVDEYGKGHPRTLADLKMRAQQIQNELVLAEQTLDQAVQAYEAYYLGQQLDIRKFAYRKSKRRTIFRDLREEQVYFARISAQERYLALEEQKADLIHGIIILVISLKPGEDPTRAPKRFLRWAHAYHERWSIENAFRDVKQRFLLKKRTRKSTQRLVNLLFGLKLYNFWQVIRRLDFLEQERARVWNVVSYDPYHPYIRKKFERDVKTSWTAQALLVRMWRISMQERLNL